MKGIIFEINWQRGMVAVLTENEDFSIFELLSDCFLEKGDEVEWKEDTALGLEKIKNNSKDKICEVYFQNHHISKHQLKEQLLY